MKRKRVNEQRDRVEMRAAGNAEKRDGGKRERVNENRDRVERGKQGRQKKGKVGHER